MAPTAGDPVREAVREAAAGFARRYGAPPEAVVFAPGRVNLIGEHLDYCGLPVLPAALSRGLALAVRRGDGPRIRCATTEPGHDPVDFTPAPAESSAGGPGEARAGAGFGRYLAASAEGLRLGDRLPDGGAAGFDGFLASSLPAASGLSSSSALVVAGALALLFANGRLAPGDELDLPERMRLAADLAAAERGAAIRGGAMDQSVCLGAAAGHALLITSEPARWTPVAVPPARFAFLAAFTGERAEKGGAAKQTYNARVVEAAAALAELRKLLGARGSHRTLIDRYPEAVLLEAVRRLPPPLDRRMRHLVTETHRVRRAVRCLREGAAEELGALLDASHRSLREDYRVSAPALDALVEEARAAGALGARLTGAGLGGSVAVLTRPEDREAVAARLRDRFYLPRGIREPSRKHLLDGTPSGPAALLPRSRRRAPAGRADPSRRAPPRRTAR